MVVSASEGYVRHEMSEFLGVLVGIGGTMGLGAAAFAMLIVIWGLRPIGQTAAVLGGITHRTLGHEHLDALRAPRELRPFISTVSEMLARVNRGILQQQQFIADASHELRTPLALAKSTLQAVRSRDRQTLEYQRAVDETLDDLDRMERLINQLLVLTRMDETEGLADVADVPLDALLVQLAAEFDVQARAGGGRVMADSLPAVFVRGNEDLLTRLFSNLLDNAITHGPEGGTVQVSLEPQEGTLCEVSIHDTGGRIPPEALPRLFDRFFRADPSRARKTGGRSPARRSTRAGGWLAICGPGKILLWRSRSGRRRCSATRRASPSGRARVWGSPSIWGRLRWWRKVWTWRPGTWWRCGRLSIRRPRSEATS